MLEISVREFQLHQAKYLKKLPLVLTQYNKPVAKVISPNESTMTEIELIEAIERLAPAIVNERIDEMTKEKSTTTYKKDGPEANETLSVINVDLDKINFLDASQLQDPNFGLVRARHAAKCVIAGCRNEGYQYRVTFTENDGEHKKDVYLYDIHLKQTKDSGDEVTEL